MLKHASITSATVVAECSSLVKRLAICSAPYSSNSKYSDECKQNFPNTDVPIDEAWQRRMNLRRYKLQRDEQVKPKLYYAPEWNLFRGYDGEDSDHVHPMAKNILSPEKWEYNNKVVWPPNFVNPETGLPLLRQVYHCKQSFHYSSKRMWKACQFAWRMNVDEAIVQLRFQQNKGCNILLELLEEAKQRARNEFHVEYPSSMHVAEAFPTYSSIVKGIRRHARDNYNTIRYRYIHLYVRLEEGDGPGFKGRLMQKDGWQKMREYYQGLRDREMKYSI